MSNKIIRISIIDFIPVGDRVVEKEIDNMDVCLDEYLLCGCGSPDEHCAYCISPKFLHDILWKIVKDNNMRTSSE